MGEFRLVRPVRFRKAELSPPTPSNLEEKRQLKMPGEDGLPSYDEATQGYERFLPQNLHRQISRQVDQTRDEGGRFCFSGCCFFLTFTFLTPLLLAPAMLYVGADNIVYFPHRGIIPLWLILEVEYLFFMQ